MGNRYQPLAEDYHNGYYSQQPFLGHRGRGGRGGTPRRNSQTRNNKGGDKHVVPKFPQRGPETYQREDVDAGQAEGNNPKKRMREVEPQEYTT